MATIDTRLVERELKAIIASSNAIKSQLRNALERMEESPSSFDELSDVPDGIRHRGDVCLRKVKLVNQKHDFRIVFAHWTYEGREDHVDLLLAFPREKDYRIDWGWVEQFMDDK